MIAKEHLSGYQARDREIIDYQMYQLPDTQLYFRGKPIGKLQPQEYFACIGAAQTFGCFCPEPFPSLLEKQLELPTLNLGYGGAGPYFYLKHPKLLSYLNQAKFVIVQVMSGRSESNSLFESGGLEFLTRRSDGAKLGAQTAYESVIEANYLWQKAPFAKRYIRKLVKFYSIPQTKKLVAQTRRNWVENYQTLLEKITVPKILFWFSKRSPHYQEKYGSVNALFNEFPQMVNSAMIAEIKPYCDDYVECISDRGSPQPLVSRFTGQPTTVNPAADRQDLGGSVWSHNLYYPSPEMHQDGAKLLAESTKKFLN